MKNSLIPDPIRSPVRRGPAGVLMLSLLAAAASVNAQMLEEVLVTATKRTEGLQDVPISMSVMQGAMIQEQGLADLEDLAVYMPNVHIAQAGAGDQLFIRGIGSGVNYGFEQSVGTFIDGVYYGRGRNSRAAFLDLERVEVLKGPQSTLFGKNTIAGAINITTAKPTDEFEGYVEGTYETELDGYGITGVVSGPLTDNFRGRLVAKYYDDDGYVENKATGDDEPANETSVVRATLAWDATTDLSFTLKAEHGEFDVTGRQEMISKATPSVTALYRAYGDPSFKPGFEHTTYSRVISPKGHFDNTDSDIYQLTAEYQMGEYTLRSITAYTEYDFKQNLDSDNGPVPFIDRGREEDHEQFSQEFLLTSPVGGTFEYLAGAYYQKNELQNDRVTTVIFSSLPPIEAAILGLVNSQLPLGLESGDLDVVSGNTFQQDTETWSAFAELTWNITDVFRITGGLRYSDETKDMEKALATIEENYGNVFLVDLIYCVGLKFSCPHSYEFNRGEDHWTGSINVQYDIGDTMVYLNLANGFKAGGFDEDNALGALATAEFEDESVDSIEIGTKMDLLGGRMRLNAAAFYSEYNDVQVSAFDGNAGFVVLNAAESEVKGVEADWQYAATEHLTLTGSIAYLDAEYKDFPNAPCNVEQIQAWVAAGNPRATCPTSNNLGGEPLQFAPDWSANLGFDYWVGIGNALELKLSAYANYQDDTVIANDLDPYLIRDDYWNIDARVQLGAADGTWSLAVVGKNLTDEKVFNWGNDVPLGSVGFDDTYFRHISPPRTYQLQARYSF